MINQHPGGERPAAGLVMEQIGKRFASVTALNAVTLRLNPGEIHGLIGENGAGKSTLIKILAGVYQADSGSATLDGHPLPLGNPAAIEAAGIRVIHQELNLIPHFTVAESVFLGQEYRTRWGALDRRRMKAATAQFFQQNWQLAIDPERLVRDLSLAERKLVQIARALIDGAARLVVFDEPTAPLEAQEASLVSSAILRLRDQGIAILYISHYLNEIATLCDRGTVLRNGEVVGYPDRDLLQNTEALIAMMVGREIDQLYTPRQRPAADNGATPLLSVRQLSDGRQLQELSHHRIIITMSQKRKLLPAALGLLSLASLSVAAADALSLQGKTIGVAVVGTQHFWDREAFKGATEEVEKLGGKVIGVDGGRDNQVHANNHDILLSRKVDAVISILGDSAVEPKFKALRDAGIPVFTVDHVSQYSVNNTTSDNYTLGSTIGRYMADELGGKGNVAVFNAFSSALRICGIRYDQWKYVLKDYPDIHIIQPELAEQFANSPEDARKKTLELLSQYPKGKLDAIHVACWDQPAIGIVQALEETGRDKDVKVTAIDAGPETLEIMAEPGSPFVANVAQQPHLIGQTSADNVARYFAGQKLPVQTFIPVVPVKGPQEAKAVYKQLGYGELQ
ncbi:hypothetical protein C3483_18695 [Klebsiella pneumoniae]|nr:hypothetical protein C3483_18695 [Klebsiella pneumoniae]